MSRARQAFAWMVATRANPLSVISRSAVMSPGGVVLDRAEEPARG